MKNNEKHLKNTENDILQVNSCHAVENQNLAVENQVFCHGKSWAIVGI